MDAGGDIRATIRHVLIYGALSGALIAVLRVVQYQYLVIEHSIEIYGALIAALFAGLGIWLGLTITRKRPEPEVIVREVPVPVEVPAGPFFVNEARVRELGLTPRELEILGLIAEGLSTREIAERAFVSESTVKTHASRLFDKLGAKRRTQAVQIGKSAGLIP